MLIKPVSLYVPSQYDGPSFAAPLRVTLMLQQGCSGWLVHVKLVSSLYSPSLETCQPVIGGCKESDPLAFKSGGELTSPTRHSSPVLYEVE